MSEIKLLPCPFCGSHKVSVVNVAEYGCFIIVKCNNCGCNTSGKSDEHESSVIKKWNTRKPMERIIERIESFPHGDFNVETMEELIEIVKEEGGIE